MTNAATIDRKYYEQLSAYELGDIIASAYEQAGETGRPAGDFLDLDAVAEEARRMAASDAAVEALRAAGVDTDIPF